MKSIAYIPASDGSANASLMTVSTVRAPLASTILVNTVANVPNKFYGSMGTPNTFTDPITGETITVISEATAVDFAGHVDGSNIEIDAIAPGYTDLGSAVGDIIIIRPNTEWANNIFNILSQSHNDDGTFKDNSITTPAQFTDNVDPVLRRSDSFYDHVASGAILAGLGYGSTLTASLSAGVCYINGERQLIAAVATRGYTANKDTYVDALYNASGTATIVYTEVANNAASPALAANSIRLAIVVTGASNIAASTSINQGRWLQATVPVISSAIFEKTDSLGNLIHPTDPSRVVLGGFNQAARGGIATATPTVITGGKANILIPTGGRDVEIFADFDVHSDATNLGEFAIFVDGVVVKSHRLPMNGTGGWTQAIHIQANRFLAAGYHYVELYASRATGSGNVIVNNGTVLVQGK